MEELLKELDFTNEQINKIKEGMANKKIYTSAEENIDLRYSKLKEDFTGKEAELTKANELIEQLQKSNKGNEDLQSKVTEYETTIANMQKEQHNKNVENAIKLELLKSKAKAKDIDYLIFQIKSKQGDKEFELDEKGNLKDFDCEDVKKEYEDNFEDDSNTFVDVKKLGGAGQGSKLGVDGEPATLLDALKEKYAPSEEI